MFFLSHCCQSPSLAGSHSPPHLPRMPSNTVLIFRAVVAAAQILIWSCSYVFLPPMSTVIRTSEVSFAESPNDFLYIPFTQSLPSWSVDLICSLYSWWEAFGSSSSAPLPLGFSCPFISTSACGLSTGVCSWGCPGGLGFAPGRARHGGGASAWVAGVLAAPGTQGGWRLGQQEI